MTGMYATVAILAALRHAERTGQDGLLSSTTKMALARSCTLLLGGHPGSCWLAAEPECHTENDLSRGFFLRHFPLLRRTCMIS
jgi:hypothetical protein